MDIAKRTSNFWRYAKRLPAQVPLRYRLIAAELALVGVALAVISVTGFNYLRSYLLKQQNQELQSQVNSILLQSAVQNDLAAELAGTSQARHESTRVAADWLSAGRLYPVIYPVSGNPDFGTPQPVPGPRISATASWLGLDEPTIVGAQAGSGSWDVASTPMVVVTPKGPVEGMLIVGVDISPVDSTLGRLAETDIFVSVLVLLGLLVLGIVIIRLSLRPVTDITQTADAVSAGDLGQRMPEAGRRTEFGSAGRSVNKMLGHIEAAVHARSTSERAARRSEQRTRNLLADLSHELRTPLTAIRGFAEYYRHRGRVDGSAHRPDVSAYEPAHRTRSANSRSGDGLSPSHNGAGPQIPPELERIIGRVEQESERMADLLEDMLLLAEVGQEGALDSARLDLLALTEEAVGEARLTDPNCTINLDSSEAVTDDEGGLPTAGDKNRLRKAVGIMMRNALAQAPEGTAIDVRISTASRAQIGTALSAAEADADAWPGFIDGTERSEAADERAAAVLEVTDRGRGLTEEQCRYAFDRYCRVSAADSGLGLTVVAAVVKAHGGAAWVRPEGSKGTAYCIAVPLAEPAPEVDDDEAGAAAEDADPLTSGQGMIVSQMAGRAGSDVTGAGVPGSDVTGTGSSDSDDSQQEPETWVESGPPDEISFLGLRPATPPEQRRVRIRGNPIRTGRRGRAAGAAGAAESERASRRPAAADPDSWPVSGRGKARRTARAWRGRSHGVRRERPGRRASHGRLTTARCPTSSRHGFGWAARPARPGRRSDRPRLPPALRRPPTTGQNPWPGVRKGAAVGSQKRRPLVGLLVRQRQTGDGAGPGRAEARGPGRVELGQVGAEALGRLLAGRPLADPVKD
jgi:two-component system, OmpR family, sensor kinase